MSGGFHTSKFPFPSFHQNVNFKNSADWEWKDFSEQNVFSEYFQDTGLHGCAYIGQKGRHLCERIFWILATLTAVAGAAVLIYKMWNGFLNMPIITVFSSEEKEIHELSFPSVTICNVNSMQRSKVENFIRKVTKDSKADAVNDTEILQAYAALADYQQVCHTMLTVLERLSLEKSGKTFFKMADHIEAELKARESEYKKYRKGKNGYEMSQSCEEMIIFCLLRNTVRNCGELFKRIPTDFGFCCTFNTIPLSFLTRSENSQLENEPLSNNWKNINDDTLISPGEVEGFPFKQMYAGRQAGLSFIVNPQLKEYTCKKLDSSGFLLSLNRPLDYPSMGSSNLIAVPVDSEVIIGIRPEVIMPDSSVDKFKPTDRSCYLSNEFSLKYFTKYTQRNCFTECVANVTMNLCGCVYYLNLNGTNLKICTSSKEVACMTKFSKELPTNPPHQICPLCLHACTKIRYFPETSILKLDQENFDMLIENVPELNSTNNVSIVHLFLSTGSTFPMMRKEVYSTIDLISNAGGLLGLCMGFSLLSLLEIVYYFSIRVFWNYYKKKRVPTRILDEGKAVNEGFNEEKAQLFLMSNIPKKDFKIIRRDRGSKFGRNGLATCYQP